MSESCHPVVIQGGDNFRHKTVLRCRYHGWIMTYSWQSVSDIEAIKNQITKDWEAHVNPVRCEFPIPVHLL